MVDLGRYAAEVIAAYAATGALLGGVTLTTLLRARRVKRALDAAEARQNG
ncbi:MAG: heme exporter protein CcmD [Pseudomonadota bacterium]